jgi:hypothetical protein
VLGARSGDRLVIECASYPGRFIALAATEVASSTDDTVTGLRWHRLRLGAADVAHLPVFRRALGRLTADQVRLVLPAPPDDDALRVALQDTLDLDPLTADADLTIEVAHGVALLDGWIHTLGGKVVAERLARTTPGIWEAKNRLVSDEELAALGRQHALADPLLADAIDHLRADLGRLRVHLLPGTRAAARHARDVLGQVPGCREVTVDFRDSDPQGSEDQRGG